MNAEPNDDLTDGLNTWALTRLDALRGEADRLVRLYWGWADLQRKARPRSQWGRLGVRVRDQRNERSLPGAFGVEWFETYWVQGHQGRRAVHTRYLRRGKGLRYPRSTLSRVAKPWELAMADEFEDHFALIGGLLHSIAQVRKSGEVPWIRPDGKAQVTVELEGDKPVRVHTVVVSTQHDPDVRDGNTAPTPRPTQTSSR